MAELAFLGAKLAVGVLAPAGGMVQLAVVAVATIRPVEALGWHSKMNTKTGIFEQQIKRKSCVLRIGWLPAVQKSSMTCCRPRNTHVTIRVILEKCHKVGSGDFSHVPESRNSRHRAKFFHYFSDT
jgi:hypothetical protein